MNDSIAVLKETVGNPNARLAFSITKKKGNTIKTMVIHNPETKAYCVLQLTQDEKVANIVSWHRAQEEYGDDHWNRN